MIARAHGQLSSSTPDAYRLEVAPDWRSRVPDLARALAIVGAPPQSVLHDGPRARLAVIDHDGARLVVRQSHLERTPLRHWFSLLRASEALRAFHSQLRLRDEGVRVPDPVLGLERRRRGRVEAAWHVYRYQDGGRCGPDDVEAVADALRHLHARGFVHRDPHLGNFLRDASGVAVLDCARARRSRSPYARVFDLVLLEKCCRGLGCIGPALEPSLLLDLARLHSRALVAWRALKRACRARARS